MFEKRFVEYFAAVGGAHSEDGSIRVNPITGTYEFRVWMGLGNFTPTPSRIEVVCVQCGANAEDLAGYSCPNLCQIGE